MTTVFFAFLTMVVCVAAMAIGVILGREPIKGSCGGLNKLGVEGECEICGGNPAKCDSPASTDRAADTDLSLNKGRELAYNAVEAATTNRRNKVK